MTVAIEVVADPAARRTRGSRGPSLLPSFLYVAGEFDFPAGSLALPWQRRCRRAVDRRRAGAKARRREPVAARRVGQIVAVVRRREPHVADPAVGRAATRCRSSRRSTASARVPAASAARVGRARSRRGRRRCARRQDVFAHRAGVVRRGSARADARAAAEAGLARVTLLEEPQAACYAWIDSARRRWRRRLARRRPRARVRHRRRHDRLQPDSRRRAATATSRSSASRSAITSCSAATTWTSRSRASCSSGSRRTATASTRGSCRRCGISAASRRRRCSRDPAQDAHPGHASSARARGSSAARSAASCRATIWTQVLRRRLLPASSARTRCRRGGGVPVCRSSGCRTPPIRRSRATSRDFFATGGRRPAASAIRRGRERPRVSDARAVQRRRDEGRAAARARSSTCSTAG